MNNLFVRKIIFDRNGVNFAEYPFYIDVIQNFHSLALEKSVSIFIGENGVGKSTFIEALAVALGMNAEGGTENFHFSTKETHSCLYQHFQVIQGIYRPKTRFFLRAESFYNVASEIDHLALEDSYGGSLHECSHREAFM